MVDSFIKYPTDFNTNLDPKEEIFQHEMIGTLKRISEEDENDNGFSLKDTTEVME